MLTRMVAAACAVGTTFTKLPVPVLRRLDTRCGGYCGRDVQTAGAALTALARGLTQKMLPP